jgi:hypothetical protein
LLISDNFHTFAPNNKSELLNIDTLKLGDKGTKKATGIRIFFPPFSRDNANLRLFKVMEVDD